MCVRVSGSIRVCVVRVLKRASDCAAYVDTKRRLAAPAVWHMRATVHMMAAAQPACALRAEVPVDALCRVSASFVVRDMKPSPASCAIIVCIIV